MNPEIIRESARELPVFAECGVLVCGGGMSGCAAALAAARNGADVLLLDKGYALGGLATLGLIAYFLPLCDGKGHQVIRGIAQEFFHLATRFGPEQAPECWREPNGDIQARIRERYTAQFTPAWLQLGLEELLLEAGVRFMYDSRVCAVQKQNKRIEAVIVENKSGRGAVTCGALIDATGDADICAMAGEETVSLDSNRKAAWFYGYNDKKLTLYPTGDIFFEPVPEGSRTYAGDSWQEVTNFCIDSRKMIMPKVEAMRQNQGNETLRPVILPSLPQFRRTRRLKGVYELDQPDEGRFLPDAIGMTGYYRQDGLVLCIPYGSLIGATENLFAAGRCISSKEEFAWHITRGIPSGCITGQAAGTAAALCTRAGIAVQAMDVPTLQNTLRDQNAIIEPKYCYR